MMGRTTGTLAVVVLLLPGILTDAGDRLAMRRAAAAESSGPDASSISRADVEQALHAGAGYLVRQCLSDGRFVYRVNLDPCVRVEPKYNLVRHAGVLYALDAYYQSHPRPEVAAALVRAAGYLQTQLRPLAERRRRWAVWSTPNVTFQSGPVNAKLGTSALAATALCGIEHWRPGTTDSVRLGGLGYFLMFMQREDGSFFSRYQPGPVGRDNRWESLYYPGEAALGLVCLYEVTQDEMWLETARAGLLYLARAREAGQDVPPDHWAMIATQRLLSHVKPDAAQRRLLLRHGRLVAQSLMVRTTFDDEPIDPEFAGSSDCWGYTTRVATRLEGLQAYLRFAADLESGAQREIRNRVEQGVAFLLAAQIREGIYRGAMPRAKKRLPESLSYVDANFNQRATEVRIDYVQHAMSTWLDWLREQDAR